MSFPKTTLLICTVFLLGLLSVPSAWCVTPTASTYYFPQAVDGVSGNTFYSMAHHFIQEYGRRRLEAKESG